MSNTGYMYYSLIMSLVGHTQSRLVKGTLEQMNQSPANLRFIPLGHMGSRDLIHLLSLVFLRMVLFFHSLSMTMTETSASECPLLLKCAVTVQACSTLL